MRFALVSIAACAAAILHGASAARPNILFLLTDDQDLLLGSMDPDGPMQKTRKLLVDQGAWFDNAFVATPICCPSRAEIQTGRYMHTVGVPNNQCGGRAFIDGPERDNVAHFMSQGGYTNFYAGKYLNNYGTNHHGATNLSHIPRGWDQWFGLKGNSRYYGYVVSNNGRPERHRNDYAADYFTDYIANKSLAFLDDHFDGGGKNTAEAAGPVFMMMATPASHSPNDPAPQYMQKYAGRRAPRLPSWNVAPSPDKNGIMQTIVPMDEGHANVSDVYFQRRWSVLHSVDDMVERLHEKLEALGQLENTFFMFSSDHGYHLGEFGQIYDKRMLYETDIRVPLFIKGPGIAAGSTVSGPVSHVDLAPTILSLGGVATPPVMDGRSWLPLVKEGGGDAAWRNDLLIEYNGPKVGDAPIDPENADDQAPDAPDGAFCHANADDETSIAGKCSCTVKDGTHGGKVHDASPCDDSDNTYKCLRTFASAGGGVVPALNNSIYCEFDNGFVEMYDLDADPYNLHNLHKHTDAATLATLHARLHQFMLCSGADCFDPREK